jgi:hypothetical protein
VDAPALRSGAPGAGACTPCTGELEILKALPLVHILHPVQEALVEHSHVSLSDEEGLGGIILWLDAVCSLF